MELSDPGDNAILEEIKRAMRKLPNIQPVNVGGIMYHLHVDPDLPEDTFILINGRLESVVVTGIKIEP